MATTEEKTREIVERFEAIHGTRYGYSEVRYYGSKVKVKIVCHEPGHGVFQQTPESHLQGQGCPKCKGSNSWANRRVKTGRSFADLRPKWVYQWDTGRNGGLRPEDAYPTSKKIVWWCEPECGHHWQQRVTDRGVAALRCPVCVGDIFERGVNDLLTRSPEIAQDWHPTRNDATRPSDVCFNSGTRYWWLCSTCHKEWEAKVNSRTKGARTGCPECGVKRVWEKRGKPALEQSLAGRATQEVLDQWNQRRNPMTPRDIYYGNTTELAWWVYRGCGHEWQQSVYNRVNAAPGCPVCDGRVVVPGINDLATTNPNIAARWHPTKNGALLPSALRPYSNKKVWWVCPICRKDFQRTVTGMVSKGSLLCADCAAVARGKKKSAPVPGHSFEDEYPEIAREWHPIRNGSLRPNQVRSGSNKKVWWLCDYGHEWEGFVSQRTSPRQKRSCPHCTPGSYGERAIVDTLKAHEVKYERQWTDSSCRDQGVLPFDFVVPERHALIEFDGEQHRRPARFGRSAEEADAAFAEQQRRDAIKTVWALENGWDLIRVSSIESIEDVLRANGII